MVITSYGLSCFKVSSGETVLAFDPPSKKSKLKSPYFQTDMVLISHAHDDHSGKDVLHGKGDESPFVIDGPGEYEHKGISVIGIPSMHDDQGGKKYGKNTVYRVRFEDVTLMHLGDYGEEKLNDEIKKHIEGVDILFLPIGGDTVLDVSGAIKIANAIEPRIIIPMHYDASSKKKTDAVKSFLSEMGAEDTKPDTKFTFKKKDLPIDETNIILLEPSP
ncbi:MAG: MBL fold metallo-hydrolase [Candidatus Niyogibacteria bacterium]|nr:MBL fold metallo-hydrolase [Candidatus Niyogibacteria bacterium]